MAREQTQFKKGQSGNPGGRPAGSKNKLNRNVDEICARLNCNPFEVLCRIANDDLYDSDDNKLKISVRLRMEASSELAQYIAPKLKSVEHKGDQESPVKFNIILAS